MAGRNPRSQHTEPLDRLTPTQITINDLPVGRSVDETLRLIDAFQFTDKYGEVCPANWSPGDQGIKATPAGNKEYLGKMHADTKMVDVAKTNGTVPFLER